jgi:hypothetical protein
VSRKSSDFAISLTMSADGARAAIVFAGDLDMLALPRLADAIQRLSVAVPENVTVDIEAVRFVGSVLPNFLVRVRPSYLKRPRSGCCARASWRASSSA